MVPFGAGAEGMAERCRTAVALDDGGRDAVIAVRAEAIDTGEFGQPARGTAPGEDGNEIDRLGDQRTRNGDDRFLNELFHPAQRADGAAGVDRADAMAGAPCLQQVQRLRADSGLADGEGRRGDQGRQ